MIVFSGRGYLVLVSALCAMVCVIVVGLRAPIAAWLAIALSGVLDRWLGKKWNGAEGRTMQDLKTGEIVEIKPDHSFFWIPMQHWLWIKLALMSALIVAEISRTAE